MTGMITEYSETARQQTHTCQTAGGQNEYQASVRRSEHHRAAPPSSGSAPVGRHSDRGLHVKLLFWQTQNKGTWIHDKPELTTKTQNNSTTHMHTPLSSLPPITPNH